MAPKSILAIALLALTGAASAPSAAAPASAAAATLPPRFRSHEEELSSVYLLNGVQDIGVVKGLKAVWNWMTGKDTTAPA